MDWDACSSPSVNLSHRQNGFDKRLIPEYRIVINKSVSFWIDEHGVQVDPSRGICDDCDDMKGIMRRSYLVRFFYPLVLGLLFPAALRGEPKLTGATLYSADPGGVPLGISLWNTVGGDGIFNVYFFEGSFDAPVFLNRGDLTTSAALKWPMGPGEVELGFAASTTPHGYVGLNLYFGTNRISAFRAVDHSSVFWVLPSDTPTFGLSGIEKGSGTLSVRVEDLVVTLLDFTLDLPPRDRVGDFDANPDGAPDTVGHIRLRVDAKPEVSLVIEISQIRVCWPSSVNYIYQPQYRSSDTENLWVNLGPPIVGDNGQKCVSDAVEPGNATRLYRVTVTHR